MDNLTVTWLAVVGVEELKSLAQSPALKPPKILWDKFELRLHPGLLTRHEFLTSLMLMWLNRQIPTEMIQSLVESLLRGVEAITATKGWLSLEWHVKSEEHIICPQYCSSWCLRYLLCSYNLCQISIWGLMIYFVLDIYTIDICYDCTVYLHFSFILMQKNLQTWPWFQFSVGALFFPDITLIYRSDLNISLAL